MAKAAKKTYVKSDIVRKLTVRPREITFTKENGKTRVMRATLQKDMIPKTNSVGGEPRGVVTAWDMKVKGWRSFKVSSIQKVVDLD